MVENIIELHNVSKIFHNGKRQGKDVTVKALDQVSLQVRKGKPLVWWASQVLERQL